MKTQKQVETEFKEELKALLKKWGAEIEASDQYSGYPECGEDIHMIVSIPAIYDKNGTVREYTEVDLGKYFC
jgi:hypothetical protein